MKAWSLSFPVLLSLLSLSLCACTAVQLPVSGIPDFDKHRYTQLLEGLAVSIQPFTKKEDVEKFFGINLLSNGILPVLVFAENQRADLSYIMLKNEAMLIPSAIRPENRSIQESLNSERTANVVSKGALISMIATLGYSPIALAALPLKIIGDKMSADAAEIRYNLILNELHNRMVPPGKTVLGFIYFTLPDQNNLSEKWLVRLNVINGQTKTRLNFEIPF